MMNQSTKVYKRILAFILDGIIITGLIHLINIIIFDVEIINKTILTDEVVTKEALIFITKYLLISFFIHAIYNIIFIYWKQKTPGKIVMKLKVVNLNGEKPKIIGIIGREVFKAIALMETINGLVLLFSKDRRSLGDKIFKTKITEK